MMNVISKMMKMRLQHKFCEYVPGNLQPGTIYITMEFGIAVHLGVCGCGQKVVTPFSPTDWKLIYDGETVSLDPSIGNWSFDCQSHYWIKKNQVIMSKRWNDHEINMNRQLDKEAKESHFKDAGEKSKTGTGFLSFITRILRNK